MLVLIDFNWNWFRKANKYMEHIEDKGFIEEFDYIIDNMGL